MNLDTIRNTMQKKAGSNGYEYPYADQYPVIMPPAGQKWVQYWPWQDEKYEDIAKSAGMPYGTFLAVNHITDKDANDMSRPLLLYAQPDVVPKGYMLTPGAREYVERLYNPDVWKKWGLTQLPWLQGKQAWQPYTDNGQNTSSWPWGWMDNVLDAEYAAESTNGKNRVNPTPGSTALGGYGLQMGAWTDVNQMFPSVTAGHTAADRKDDDVLSRNVAGHYQKRYMPWFTKKYGVNASPDWALALHHMGPGGVLRKMQDQSNPWQRQTTHTVANGETGMGIANKYKIPWTDFQSWNPGVDWKKIRPGQKLNLAAPQPQQQQPKQPGQQ